MLGQLLCCGHFGGVVLCPCELLLFLDMYDMFIWMSHDYTSCGDVVAVWP